MEYVRDNQKCVALTAGVILLSIPVSRFMIKNLESWLMASLPSLPEFIQRRLIQSHLRWWSKRLEAGGDAEKQHFYREKMVKIFRENEEIAIATEEAKEQHYEVPTDFFKLSLGPWLKYSSCYWPSGCTSLRGAEEAMLEKICERAEIKDGMRILDLGCGWGSCGLYLLKKYPSVHVTFFSNSTTQQAYIQEQAKKYGNGDRIKVL